MDFGEEISFIQRCHEYFYAGCNVLHYLSVENLSRVIVVAIADGSGLNVF